MGEKVTVLSSTKPNNFQLNELTQLVQKISITPHYNFNKKDICNENYINASIFDDHTKYILPMQQHDGKSLPRQHG